MPTSATAKANSFEAPWELPPIEIIFGLTPAMNAVRQKAEKVAQANVPVLMLGESGTGKELVARYIHRCSPWRPGPFVKVSCPAIPGTLLESELFGYEKGAFTGAYGMKPGRVEMASRGTLFLDEIAELDMGLQAKLLQLLQDGQFCRIGAQEDKKAEVRVVCATNRHLEEEIQAGSFRQDLFFRINVVSLRLLPLRERIDDLTDLVNYLLSSYEKEYERQVPPVSRQLMRLMQKYHWPGNIRELENLIKRYVILGLEEAISGELMKEDNGNGDLSTPMVADGPISLKKATRQAVQELERKIILKTLAANSWNRRRAARALDISYRALLYKIRQAGLPPKRAGRRAEQVSDSSTIAD
jgi:two-component system, NtrC family, response regulator AtoC